MTVVISMLRGVNVGGHNKIKMEALRALYESLKLRDAQTYVQSGNVIFRSDERDITRLAKQIEDGIERKFGFRPNVILRTAAEMRDVVARNPFAKRRGIEPSKLLVSFLASDPGEEAREKVRQMKWDPEEWRIEGRELYIYFPNGMGRSKLPWAGFEKTLKTPGTGRNWNSVTRMLGMAETMEGSKPRRIPGREYGRSIFSSLASSFASFTFSIGNRVGWRIGSTFGRCGFTARDSTLLPRMPDTEHVVLRLCGKRSEPNPEKSYHGI